MEQIRDFRLKHRTTNEFVLALSQMGVFGAGRVARATDLLEKVIREKHTLFLCVAGPIAPAGLGALFSDMVKEGWLSGLVVSGANLSHDIAHAIGGKSYHSSKSFDEVAEDENAAGDLIIPNQTFMRLETKMKEWLPSIIEGKKSLCSWELLREIGKKLKHEKERVVECYIETCYEHNVPIFSPGITDSMLGFHYWINTQGKDFIVDIIRDYDKISDMVYNSDKTSALILGGGLPKHYMMEVAMLKEGLHSAIQITVDRPESGSMSGASLEEGKTWGKIKKEAEIVDVVGDATILFPLIVSAIKERLG